MGKLILYRKLVLESGAPAVTLLDNMQTTETDFRESMKRFEDRGFRKSNMHHA